MKKKTRSYILNVVAILLLYVVLSFLMENEFSRGNRTLVINIGIAIIMATSLNLTTGFLGELALGHAGFMAIGAYAAALFTKNMPMDLAYSMPLGLIIGGLVAAVFGLLIGIPALRLKGDYLAIITLGFGEIIRVIINNLPFTGGAMGLLGIKRVTNFDYVYVFTVLIIACLFTLARSRHGRAILSIRENEVAAESTGIPTTYYKIFAFTLAAFFAGIAGGLYAHQIGSLTPAKFNFNSSIEYLVMVVLGGMGSITGSIIAASVLTLLPNLLRFLSEWRMLIYSILLIVMMLFRPKGLLGTAEFSLVAIWDRCAKFMRNTQVRLSKHFSKNQKPAIMPEVPKYDYGNFNLPVMETKNLGIRFGGLQAAQGVEIKLYDNEIVGLIGPNGAGKTTVFNMLTGVYRPTEGDIVLLGKSLVGKSTHAITANGIARTFQNIRLFKSMTVLENIKVAFQTRMSYTVMQGILRTPKFAREEQGIELRARELLSVFDMEDVAETRADSLPYGQQRKLEICRALASNPKVLLLDEPAAGMNPSETEELMKTIQIIRERFSVTILLIEHDMKLVMGICERLYVLNYGKVICEGLPKDVSKNEEVIAAYLGTPTTKEGA